MPLFCLTTCGNLCQCQYKAHDNIEKTYRDPLTYLNGLPSLITLTSLSPRWRLKSPASRLFTVPLIQTQIKENIKAPHHWPLRGQFTGTGEFPAQRTSYAGNVSIWWRHHVMSSPGQPSFSDVLTFLIAPKAVWRIFIDHIQLWAVAVCHSPT